MRWRVFVGGVVGAVAIAALGGAGAAGQATSVLRVTVTLPAADGGTLTPITGHGLLVSEEPVSTAPRRIVTGADGRASLRVRPGRYTVESERPLAFQGREYQWIHAIEVPAAGEVVLSLTAANAESGPLTAASASPAGRPADPSDVLSLWQGSVLTVWTPTRRVVGVLVDPRGLLVTSRQMVGEVTAVEVQVSPSVKRAARVIVSDAARDVAVLWMDAAALASVRPVPLGCASPPALTNGQEVLALDSSSGSRVRVTSGKLGRVASPLMIADFSLDEASVGGPVFSTAGVVVGLASVLGDKEGDRRESSRVVRLDAVCAVVATATAALGAAAAPSATPLPVEPLETIPGDALREIARARAGSLAPATVSSAGFDVSFLTPLQVYAGGTTMEFANWTDYVIGGPSVLLLRVTPKQVESFWVKVARGMARTQGMAIPPIKRFRAGFSRLVATCGQSEVQPIHPFLLERRVSETDAVYEGLYVFHPDAFAPECGTVRLDIYSDKAPGVADPATVDAGVLKRVWQDFAPYRQLVGAKN